MAAALIDAHFVRLGTFDRAAKGLLSDDDEREIGMTGSSTARR
jgi:hypothetical protein